MDSRLQDMLTLVSRVQEKRGDIRFLLHQDPTVRREVHTYLDDLTWLAQLPPVQPAGLRVAAAKEQLLASLNGQAKGRHKVSAARVLGATASLSLLFGLVASTQAMTDSLPAPIEQMISSILFPHEHHIQASSSLRLDLSTPAESALEAAGPGFTP